MVIADADPPHAPHVNMRPSLVLTVTQGSITFEGPDPWVDVTGDIEEDGRFTAEGTGTVAGFPNISVVFSGTLTLEDGLVGDYTLGSRGGLPGGKPITYRVRGRRVSTLEEETSKTGVETVEDFANAFVAAMRADDTAALFERLHPAVIDLYGADACRDYLEQVVDPDFDLEILGVSGPEPWVWEIDERSIPIDAAYAANANLSTRGSVNEVELHLAPFEGRLLWFTDCGDPLR